MSAFCLFSYSKVMMSPDPLSLPIFSFPGKPGNRPKKREFPGVFFPTFWYITGQKIIFLVFKCFICHSRTVLDAIYTKIAKKMTI